MLSYSVALVDGLIALFDPCEFALHCFVAMFSRNGLGRDPVLAVFACFGAGGIGAWSPNAEIGDGYVFVLRAV